MFFFRNNDRFLANDELPWTYAVHRWNLLSVRFKSWTENDGKEAGIPIKKRADSLQRDPSAFQYLVDA